MWGSTEEDPSFQAAVDAAKSALRDEEVLEEEEELVLCSYCGVSSDQCLVQCLTCDKWFCNGRFGIKSSHAVVHLVRSHHKEIRLHPASPLGSATLECYVCGGKNVLVLGFVPALTSNVVVLLCRNPCASTASVKDLRWEPDEWLPLIQERCFLDWLVVDPVSLGIQKEKMTLSTLSRLEEAWKVTPHSTVEHLEEQGLEDVFPHLELAFESEEHYRSMLMPLVCHEAETDRLSKESRVQSNIDVVFSTAVDRRITATFSLHRFDAELRLVEGDDFQISLGDWRCKGTVTKVSHDDITVSVDTRRAPNVTSGYEVEMIWKSISYDRMYAALKKLEKEQDCMHPRLKAMVLGQDVQAAKLPLSESALPTRCTAPGLPSLNHSQVSAVQAALTHRLTLIQGPPGTGKTVTSASIVYQWVQMEGKLTQNQKILVVAPSNVAVDHLTEKIHRTGVKVVRVCARTREALESSVDFLSLHYLVRHADDHQKKSELNRLFRALENSPTGELPARDRKKWRALVGQAERRILSRAQVICSTCVGAGDIRLKKYRFTRVLIDESTQATEPETLIPLVAHAQQVCLVGDHCQLGPVVLSRPAARAGLQRSLFERWVALGIRPHRLEVQYRMHPALSKFPSTTFYDGTLQNGVSIAERTLADLQFPWPVPSAPWIFYHVQSPEEIAASGTSYLNRGEATVCERVITAFLQANVRPEQIGIITPYQGQRAYIVDTMARTGSFPTKVYEAVEVASVDSFQGREKDFIILSCVRSSEHQGIGFLSDARRLNVAITRARIGLVLLGNAQSLSRQSLWYELLRYAKSSSVLVQGPLAHLRPCPIILKPPRGKKKAPQEKFVYASQDYTFTSLSQQSDLSFDFSQDSFSDLLSTDDEYEEL